MSITVSLTIPPQTYYAEEDGFLIPAAAPERNCVQIPPNILTSLYYKKQNKLMSIPRYLIDL